MAHKIPSEFAERSELTFEQVRLAEERLKIRQRLRKEFIAKVMDPHQHGRPGQVFDPMMQRYISSHTAYYEYMKATPRSALKALLMSVVPIGLLAYVFHKDRSAYEENCRTGRIPYKDRMFKTV